MLSKRLLVTLFTIFGLVIVLGTRAFGAKAAVVGNPYPECPPNSSSIWVNMNTFGQNGESVINVPFENGFDKSDVDGGGSDFGTGDVNYVTGVLWHEIGPVQEVGGRWSKESIQAMAVAARTLTYNWCGIFTFGGHRGMDDSDKQKYNPHRPDNELSPEEKERYRSIVEQMPGVYMTYQGKDFDVLYKDRTGSRTNTGIPSPPHVDVADPVGAEYGDLRRAGMPQINADHWASGNDPTKRDPFHPAWKDYRLILVHYYTGIHIQELDGTLLTRSNRWNPLEIDWGTKDNRPPIMYREGEGEGEYPVTIQVQNSSIDDWLINGQSWALSYHWSKRGFGEIDSKNRAWTSVNVPKGDPPYTFALTIDDIPDWGEGSYTLKFDMLLSYDRTYWFSRTYDWPTLNVNVCVEGPCRQLLPITTKQYVPKRTN